PGFPPGWAVGGVGGMVGALGGSPYELMLFDVESGDRQRRTFELLDRGDRADGLLIVSTLPTDSDFPRLRAAHVPCVLVDARHESIPSAVVDDVAGGEMAARHLIELGHTLLASIAYTPPASPL